MEDAQFGDFQSFVLSTLAEINVVETCPLGGQGAPSNEQHLDDLFDLGGAMSGGHESGGMGLGDDDDDDDHRGGNDNDSSDEEDDFDPRDGNEDEADAEGKQGG
jgi:hypothetical protein